jgi:hypothetical protein
MLWERIAGIRPWFEIIPLIHCDLKYRKTNTPDSDRDQDQNRDARNEIRPGRLTVFYYFNVSWKSQHEGSMVGIWQISISEKKKKEKEILNVTS